MDSSMDESSVKTTERAREDHQSTANSNAVREATGRIGDLSNLLRRTITVADFKKLYNVIPNKCLSYKKSEEIMLILLQDYNNAPTKQKMLLIWICGLLEHNLIDFKAVYVFYHLLFRLLYTKIIMRWVCKLIFLLTRSSKDVTKIRIKMMIRAHKMQYCLPSTRAMLLLFKCLKPELILFEVSCKSIENAFPKYPPELKANLQQAEELSMKHLASIWIKPGGHKNMKQVIPDIDVVNLQSFYIRKMSMKQITDCDSMTEVATIDWSRVTLANASSLLTTVEGRHAIIYGTEEFKRRCFFWLQLSLVSAIRAPTSEQELDLLLTCVHDLFEQAQQGEVEILKIILDYFYEYRILDNRLLDILSWTNRIKFNIIEKKLLNPLKIIILSEYNQEIFQEIFEFFEKFIVNYVTCHIYPHRTKLKHRRDVENISAMLLDWLRLFCRDILRKQEICVLENILDLYCTISVLKKHLRDELSNCVVVPHKNVLYESLRSTNFNNINTMAHLLNIYVEWIPELAPGSLEMQMIHFYSKVFSEVLVGQYRSLFLDEGRHFSMLRNHVAPTLNLQFGLVPYLRYCNFENDNETFKKAVNVCESRYPDVYLFFQNFFASVNS